MSWAEFKRGSWSITDGRASTLLQFMERLWRSLKYEEVYLKAYESVAQARRGIDAYFEFYNHQRLHQALGYRTPRQVLEEGVAKKRAVADNQLNHSHEQVMDFISR